MKNNFDRKRTPPCIIYNQPMDVQMARTPQKKTASNNLRKSSITKSNKGTVHISDSSSDDAPLEFVDMNSPSSYDGQKIIVDADRNDQDEVIVGEDLFMEMCDAWLQTHGNEALIKALTKNKAIIQDAVVVAIKTNKIPNVQVQTSSK